jgi:hypothetical protein
MAAFLATHDLHTPRVENVHRLDSVLLPLGFLLFRKIQLLWPGKKIFHHRANREPRGMRSSGDSAIKYAEGVFVVLPEFRIPWEQGKIQGIQRDYRRKSKFCPKFANSALQQGISREFTVLERK